MEGSETPTAVSDRKRHESHTWRSLHGLPSPTGRVTRRPCPLPSLFFLIINGRIASARLARCVGLRCAFLSMSINNLAPFVARQNWDRWEGFWP